MTRPEAFAFAAGAAAVTACAALCWPRALDWASVRHGDRTRAYNAKNPRLVLMPGRSGVTTRGAA